jgi:hypothetical protein
LVDNYVTTLISRVVSPSLAERDLIDAVRKFSWVEMAHSLIPRTITRTEFARSSVGKEIDQALLDVLEKRIGLVSRTDSAGERLRISFDPVAEYLAAIYLVLNITDDAVSPSGPLISRLRALTASETHLCWGFLRSIFEACVWMDPQLFSTSEDLEAPNDACHVADALERVQLAAATVRGTMPNKDDGTG